MGRSLSLLTRLPSFEDDGVTHRRDCDCARCDAGFGPSEHDRADAQKLWEEKRAQAATERALARKKEGERLRRAEVGVFVSEQIKAADEHLRALHSLESRIRADRRLHELWRLRGRGLSWSESMDEIDRRFPSPEGE